MSSDLRSYNCLVRMLAWLAMVAAHSGVPPFFRYAVILVARMVRLPIRVAIPARSPGAAIAQALAWGRGGRQKEAAPANGAERFDETLEAGRGCDRDAA